MHVTLLQSYLTLCNPMDGSPRGSSVQGILQIRILEWVAMPFSRGSFQLRDWTHVSYGSCIGRHVLLLLVPPGNLRAVQLLISLDTGFIMSFFFLGSYIFLNIRQYMLKRGGWEIIMYLSVKLRLVFLAHCSGSSARAGILVYLLIFWDQNLKVCLAQWVFKYLMSECRNKDFKI